MQYLSSLAQNKLLKRLFKLLKSGSDKNYLKKILAWKKLRWKFELDENPTDRKKTNER